MELVMKITKRQLRRIIKEAMPAGGVPDVVGAITGVHGERQRRRLDPNLAIKDFKEWARDYMGTASGPNSSSVLATYIVDQGLSEAEWMEIALGMGFTPRDVGLEVVRQQKESDAGGTLTDEELYQQSFKEGKMKITKKKLKRLIREAMEDLPVLGGQPPHEGSDSSMSTETEIENSIMRTLENKQGIDGVTLVQRVISEVPSVDQDSVFSFLDVLLEDGVVYFNVEEDEWSLA
jgi:hypothetical protein